MFTSCKDCSTDKDSTSNAKDFRYKQGVLEMSGGRTMTFFMIWGLHKTTQ